MVPYSQIYGQSQPESWPWHQNRGQLHAELPADTPYAIIGASSVTYRETDPQGGDPFNIPYSGNYNYRWLHQGTDTSLYADNEIYALRILALLPLTDRSYSDGLDAEYWSWGEERIRILGEIPLRRASNPNDTSFLLKIPADTPFTFQAIDDQGQTLFTAQTWHSLRAGEVRTDCGGCHAHSVDPIPFDSTLAGQPGFEPVDLTLTTPLLTIDELTEERLFVDLAQPMTDIEYFRDVQPILENNCVGCHTADPQPPYTFADVLELDLDSDDEMIWVPWRDWPATYYRLVKDSDALYGPQPMNPYGKWFSPQATRYLRPFQSRQSLLSWKVWGERQDGRNNSDRPTETIPGDPNSFPAGENPAYADIDYIGDIMPPPGHGTLTFAEKMMISRWIDMGAPIHFAQNDLDHPRGYFADDLRPVLWAGPTNAEACLGPRSQVSLGAYDLESGLDSSSLWLSFDVAIGGIPADTNLAAGLQVANGAITTIDLPQATDLAGSNATMTARITDGAGHTTEITRAFGIDCGLYFNLDQSIHLPIIRREE